MSLHNGIDTVAFVSLGLYTENYKAISQENINILFVSLGLVEGTPPPSTKKGQLNTVLISDS